jgi:hypothetical protein
MKSTPLRRRVATAVVAIAVAGLNFACGSTGATTGTPARASAPVTVESFRYQPFTAQYRIASRNHTEQEMGGQVNAVDFSLAYFIGAQATPAGDAMRLTMTVDSIVPAGSMPPGVSVSDLQGALGATFSGTLAPTGEVSDFQGGTGTGQFLEQLNTSMRRFLPMVPADGAHANQTWSDSATISTSSAGLDLEIATVTDYQAGSWGTYAGVQALEVNAVSQYTIAGGGSQGGTEITIDGTGTSHIRLHFGANGTLLSQASADTANFTATVLAMGAIIPVTQIRHDTVSVVR